MPDCVTVASVLVQEHDEHVRTLLEAQLAALGHEALVCGEEGARWSPRHFDVAIVEPAIPPGLQLARDLRIARPGTPLVLASVMAPTDETRALAPVVHLLKPFRLAELAEALALALASGPVGARC